jgi:hypothetical protein
MNHKMTTASIDMVSNRHLSRETVRSAIKLAFWSGIVALFIVGPLLAGLQAQNYLTNTGTPSFATPYPVAMGSVDAASGNLHLEIPLGSFPQRGGSNANVKLAYDSHIWEISTDSFGLVWQPNGTVPSEYPGGWRLIVPYDG